jgi:hypothetical protein
MPKLLVARAARSARAKRQPMVAGVDQYQRQRST